MKTTQILVLIVVLCLAEVSRVHAQLRCGLPDPELREPVERWLADRSRASDSTPAMREIQGFVVIEDDQEMLQGGRAFDLDQATLRFVPVDGGGFDITREELAHDPNYGVLAKEWTPDWEPVEIDLPFAFPFGAESYTHVYLTPNTGLFFVEPNAPGYYQYGSYSGLATGCTLSEDGYWQRSIPRASPLMGGALWSTSASNKKMELYLRQTSDTFVATWYSNYLETTVQAILRSNGEIAFSYIDVPAWKGYGAVQVATADTGWMMPEPVANGADPEGDINDEDLGTIDGTMLDIVDWSLARVANTNLYEVTITVVGDVESYVPPSRRTIYYSLCLPDIDGKDRVVTVGILRKLGGPAHRRVYTSGACFEVSGGTVTIGFTAWDDLFEFAATAYVRTGFQPLNGFFVADEGDVFTFTPSPAGDLGEIDFSEVETISNHTVPAVEPFTFPALDHDEVWERLVERYGFVEGELDGVAIYQNHLTDIAHFAGAYFTRGCPGVNGIGNNGSKMTSLIHMNAIRFGWNATDMNAVGVLNHEFGHLWLFRVNAGGLKANGLDPHPRKGAHMPAAFNLFTEHDCSTMGGATWTDNGDNTFTSAPVYCSYGYSWFELYLMGLASPDEVPDTFWIDDDGSELDGGYYPPPNTTYAGWRYDVSGAAIATGRSVEYPGATQRDFKVLHVLMTRPEFPLTAADVSHFVYRRDRWPGFWSAATGERATAQAGFDLDLHADADDDGDVDLRDFLAFQTAFTGTSHADASIIPSATERFTFDANYDGDIDIQDFVAFMAVYTGPK